MKHVFLTLLFLGALFTVSVEAQTCKPAACTTKDGKPACIVDGKVVTCTPAQLANCTPAQVAACQSGSAAATTNDQNVVLAAIGATTTDSSRSQGPVTGCQPAAEAKVASTTPACQDHKTTKKSTRQLASVAKSN